MNATLLIALAIAALTFVFFVNPRREMNTVEARKEEEDETRHLQTDENHGGVKEGNTKFAETKHHTNSEMIQKRDIAQYTRLSYEQLKCQLEKDGYDLRGCDDEETKSLLCLNAGLVMVGERLVGLDEIISVEYRNDEWWDDNDGYKTEKADMYGNYEKDSQYPTVYESNEHGESTSYIVVYKRNDEEQTIKVSGSWTSYWVLGLLQYVKERGKKLKDSIQQLDG